MLIGKICCLVISGLADVEEFKWCIHFAVNHVSPTCSLKEFVKFTFQLYCLFTQICLFFFFIISINYIYAYFIYSSKSMNEKNFSSWQLPNGNYHCLLQCFNSFKLNFRLKQLPKTKYLACIINFCLSKNLPQLYLPSAHLVEPPCHMSFPSLCLALLHLWLVLLLHWP